MKHLKTCPYFVLGFVLVSCLFVGCTNNYDSVSFVKVESERTKLIAGIESYQDISEFKSFLKRNSYQWEFNEDSRPSPKGRPPFNMSTVTIKNFTHDNFSGELTVGFFNNRLISTTFYPSNIEPYIKALENAEGLKFDSGEEVKLPPHTRVRFATDHKGRKYVEWSDVRLDKEIELWIKRYS
jgi:hypothetical protein